MHHAKSFYFSFGIIEISPLQSVWGHFAVWQEPITLFFVTFLVQIKIKIVVFVAVDVLWIAMCEF